jgi:hypothetical protein
MSAVSFCVELSEGRFSGAALCMDLMVTEDLKFYAEFCFCA